MQHSIPFQLLRRVSFWLALVACSASALAQTATTAPAANKRATSHIQSINSGAFFQMQTAIGDDYFDGRDSRARVRRHLRVAKELGVGSLRCAFSWNGIQPQHDRYDFVFWDMLVDEAARAGIKLIPYVAYTPEWAARNKTEFWKQPPRDPALFAAVMTKLATRYRGRIHSWELWNEPDLNEYWQGSADEFAELVIAGAKAVHLADPDARIVLGGMSRGPGPFFETLVSKYQIGSFVDVIALHGYPESWDEERAEEVFLKRIPEMKRLTDRSGGKPELWLNEMGYADYRYRPNQASVWGTNTYYRYEHSQRYAADFLLKSFIMTAVSGQITLAGWYRIDDFLHTDRRMPADKVHYHLGVQNVNGARKPSFKAFRFFNKLFAQRVRTADQDANVHRAAASQSVVHAFERKDGKLVIAGWLRSSEYDEVPQHTGFAVDSRAERISVGLPCTASTVTNYNALGHAVSHTHPYTQSLRNVRLTGDRVFVAVVDCAKPKPIN
ncbi:MAG TPA: beta-galactosidase [Clostridia bacterium]|nr:beta-galactosidase [Clostridia bacterium]